MAAASLVVNESVIAWSMLLIRALSSDILHNEFWAGLGSAASKLAWRLPPPSPTPYAQPHILSDHRLKMVGKGLTSGIFEDLQEHLPGVVSTYFSTSVYV